MLFLLPRPPGPTRPYPGTPALGGMFLQPAEVRSIVVLDKEARLAIVATLNQMKRDCWSSESARG